LPLDMLEARSDKRFRSCLFRHTEIIDAAGVASPRLPGSIDDGFPPTVIAAEGVIKQHLSVRCPRIAEVTPMVESKS
jgi:hypothetical protein